MVNILHGNYIQDKLVREYLFRVAFTGYQNTALAVAKLKKNDFQENYRELLLSDVLLSEMIDNESLISSSYVATQKQNKLINGYTFANMENASEEQYMAWMLFSQELTYDDLERYPNSSNEVDY